MLDHTQMKGRLIPTFAARAAAAWARMKISPGTLTSTVAVRFQDLVVPFFSRTLSFESATR
jgi:hypothetical protein